MFANKSLMESPPELTPEWRFVASVYLRKRHCLVYRDDVLAVQLQVIKKRRWVFSPPKEREFYFIDGERKIFRSEAQLIAELTRRISRKPRLRTGRRSNWRRLAYSLNLF
jgi:hypothetical protein